MKKILSMILVLALALGLIACAPADNSGTTGSNADTTAGTTGGDAAQTGTFQVGFGQGDITDMKNPNGYSSYVYATCIAMTDAEDNTAILMSVDAAAIQEYVSPLQDYALQKYNIPKENIIISAIHQHNTGALDSDSRVKGAKEALDQAMEDRAPAEMYLNTVETQALTFVRHYWAKDPNRSLVTDNHNERIGAEYGYEGHEREPDNDMQLIKFDRGEEKEPVILVNFQGHPMQGYAAKAPNADWPVIMRQTVEKKLGAKVIYVSGAGGNLSSRTRIPSELSYSTDDWKAHGEKAATYVINAEDSYTKAETGIIKAHTETNPYKVGKVLNDPSLKDIAYEVEAARKISEAQADELAKKYFPRIQSRYHAQYYVIRDQLGDTYDLTIGAFSIGDVAFTFSTYEMFDDNGEELKHGTVGNEHYAAEDQLENPFKMTIISTMANGWDGYCPDAIGYQNGGYSTDITRYAPGTGEELVTDYLEILNDLYGA